MYVQFSLLFGLQNPGAGDPASEGGTDACRKFWIKPLKETDLGVAQAFLTPNRDQARDQGGARGAFAPPQQALKVRILILNIQVKECSRLNWSFKLNSDI